MLPCTFLISAMKTCSYLSASHFLETILIPTNYHTSLKLSSCCSFCFVSNHEVLSLLCNIKEDFTLLEISAVDDLQDDFAIPDVFWFTADIYFSKKNLSEDEPQKPLSEALHWYVRVAVPYLWVLRSPSAWVRWVSCNSSMPWV